MKRNLSQTESKRRRLVGKQLLRTRTDLGLTQAEFGILAGCSQATISKCETGRMELTQEIRRNILRCTGLDPLEPPSKRNLSKPQPGQPEKFPTRPNCAQACTRVFFGRPLLLIDYQRHLKTRSKLQRKWMSIRDHVFIGATVSGSLKLLAIKLNMPGAIGQADWAFVLVSVVTLVLMIFQCFSIPSFFLWRRRI